MDVREMLVELIFKSLCRHIHKSCKLAENIADDLIADGVTVQEWISTDERIPTEDDATDGYVAVVYVCGNGVKTKTISLVDVVISHPDLYDYWMPLNLRQPPKGE